MSAGAIIGKGGSNIKMVQSRSGARVSVTSQGNAVHVSGSPSAVSAAMELLNGQIQAFLRSVRIGLT
jgi:rRNA processing protein Krr1/Pno1